MPSIKLRLIKRVLELEYEKVRAVMDESVLKYVVVFCGISRRIRSLLAVSFRANKRKRNSLASCTTIG